MRKISAKWAIAGGAAVVLIGCLAYAITATHQQGIQGQQPMYSQATADLQVMPSEKTLAHDVDSVSNDVRSLRDGSASQEYGAPEQSAGQELKHDDAAGSNVALSKPAIPSIDEKIVRTANLELQVKKGKFDIGYDRALAVARKVGGYINQSKSTATGGTIASGEIMMRVPAQDFEGVLSELKKLGKVKSVDISSEDVSEEYVDLKGRLRNWHAQEAVMLSLMKKATTIQESITIQNSLSDIQMEIERISGRLNFLDNRTSYATIRLYIAEPQVIVRTENWGLGDAAYRALHASARMLGALVVLLGYLIPLTVLAGIGYAFYRAVIALRRRTEVKLETGR